MTNASLSTTVAATTAPSSENTGPSPPGPNCSASSPARLPKSFMSVSMRRRRAGLTAQPQPAPAPKVVGRCKEIIARSTNAPFALGAKSAQRHGATPEGKKELLGFTDGVREKAAPRAQASLVYEGRVKLS